MFTYDSSFWILISFFLLIALICSLLVLWKVFSNREYLENRLHSIGEQKKLELSMQHNSSLWRDDKYQNIKSLMKKAAFQADVNNKQNDIDPYPYKILYTNEAWLEFITPENVLMIIDRIERLESKVTPTDFIIPDYTDQFYWYQIYPGSKFRSHKYLNDLHEAGKEQGFNVIIKGQQ